LLNGFASVCFVRELQSGKKRNNTTFLFVVSYISISVIAKRNNSFVLFVSLSIVHSHAFDFLSQLPADFSIASYVTLPITVDGYDVS